MREEGQQLRVEGGDGEGSPGPVPVLDGQPRRGEGTRGWLRSQGWCPEAMGRGHAEEL